MQALTGVEHQILILMMFYREISGIWTKDNILLGTFMSFRSIHLMRDCFNMRWQSPCKHVHVIMRNWAQHVQCVHIFSPYILCMSLKNCLYSSEPIIRIDRYYYVYAFARRKLCMLQRSRIKCMENEQKESLVFIVLPMSLQNIKMLYSIPYSHMYKHVRVCVCVCVCACVCVRAHVDYS